MQSGMKIEVGGSLSRPTSQKGKDRWAEGRAKGTEGLGQEPRAQKARLRAGGTEESTSGQGPRARNGSTRGNRSQQNKLKT